MLAAICVAASGVSLLAHEVTYKGTVLAVNGARIQVQVIDEKTKKETAMPFELTSRTKIYRGDREVKLADARIQKDERIVVTVNHEVSATQATVVRLAPAQAARNGSQPQRGRAKE